MATTKSRRTVLYESFYWTGVVMLLACLAFILAGNTEPLYRFEHTRLPLSWTFAAIAILAFLGAELCHPLDTLKSQTEIDDPEAVPDWEAVEV